MKRTIVSIPTRLMGKDVLMIKLVDGTLADADFHQKAFDTPPALALVDPIMDPRPCLIGFDMQRNSIAHQHPHLGQQNLDEGSIAQAELVVTKVCHAWGCDGMEVGIIAALHSGLHVIGKRLLGNEYPDNIDGKLAGTEGTVASALEQISKTVH
jgi:hypothetical protein